jgi:hypothetical protein
MLPLDCDSGGLFAAIIEAWLTRSITRQEQEATGYGEVLHEHHELRLIAQVVVKHERGDQAKAGESQRDSARLVTDDDGKARAHFEQDGWVNQDAGYTHGFHVTLRAFDGADLVESCEDEYQGDQNATAKTVKRIEFMHESSPGLSLLALQLARWIGARETVARNLPVAADLLQDEQLLIAFGHFVTRGIDLDRA